MKTLLVILLLILFASYVGAFSPFTLEHINQSDDLQTFKDKTNRNSDKSMRRDRQLQEFSNGLFPQWGLDSTNADGYDTVYVTEKYNAANFYTGITPFSTGIVMAVPLTDSSFGVFITHVSGDPGYATSFYWFTMGGISTE